VGTPFEGDVPCVRVRLIVFAYLARRHPLALPLSPKLVAGRPVATGGQRSRGGKPSGKRSASAGARSGPVGRATAERQAPDGALHESRRFTGDATLTETNQALEQQSAIANVLRVISTQNTNETLNVFEAIVSSALGLTNSICAVIVLFRDERVELAAVIDSRGAQFQARWRNAFPLPLDAISTAALKKSATERVMFGLVPSIFTVDERYTRAARSPGEEALGPESDRIAIIGDLVRAAAPDLRTRPAIRLMVEPGEAMPIGALMVFPNSASPLAATQSAVLTSLAGLAEIGFEHVRLRTEANNSRAYQTATSKILRVIAESPADVQPVFDSIAATAMRLFEFDVFAVAVTVVRDNRIELAAMAADASMQAGWRRFFPLPLDRFSITGRAIGDKASQNVTDSEYTVAPEFERTLGKGVKVRSVVAAPMVRDGAGAGAIVLFRATPGKFSDSQVALLSSFADQAVIAIENARLFNEIKQALERQTAISEVLNVISSTPTNIQPVLDAVAQRAERLCEGGSATVYLREGDQIKRAATHGAFVWKVSSITLPITKESGLGRSMLEARPVHIHDVYEARGEFPVTWSLVARYAREVGLAEHHSQVCVPLIKETEAIGAIMVRRTDVRPFSDEQINLLRTFADQAVIAIENVRLFNEIQDKTRQLEVANKHKSDFLAHMSHELRTPLNAIIGFSEVLMDKMFGEVNEKQLDYLKDIHESGKHLLSLINDILDLSKIEAGRMELELSTFHMPTALSNAMTLVRERAQRHGIQLGSEVDDRLGDFDGDERKFKQIMLNLLSNAVKFTPDGGRVDVRASLDTDKVLVAVTDTGVGISPADQAALFEEFRQVGTESGRKAEGTGLGLALTRQLARIHGGDITVVSELGKGSTFTVMLPVRAPAGARDDGAQTSAAA